MLNIHKPRRITLGEAVNRCRECSANAYLVNVIRFGFRYSALELRIVRVFCKRTG